MIAEAYPGAMNDIEEMAEARGGWVCEQHPWLPFDHDDCAGPGVLRDDLLDAGWRWQRDASGTWKVYSLG